MSRVVLDASALLAVMFEEQGWKLVVPYLEDAVMSSVNAAEVQSRLVRDGMEMNLAWSSAMHLIAEVVAFDSEQARVAGDLAREGQRLGLSLGDRACLALANVSGVPAVTMDRAWSGVGDGVSIHVLR